MIFTQEQENYPRNFILTTESKMLLFYSTAYTFFNWLYFITLGRVVMVHHLALFLNKYALNFRAVNCRKKWLPDGVSDLILRMIKLAEIDK